MHEQRNRIEITAAFPDDAAEAAAQALTDAGIPASSIDIRRGVPGRETAFIRRLVVIIVLWSILGGVVGAAIGLGLALTIGPEGTDGLVFQVVCWMLIGHLTVGMIAGYWVLSDRTQRELTPGKGVTSSPSDALEAMPGAPRGFCGRRAARSRVDRGRRPSRRAGPSPAWGGGPSLHHG